MTLDPQHVAEHNLMIANLHAQCARFGLTPTSGGPYTVGDPDHIGEHGRYLDDLLTIETTAGRTFTKPIPNKNPVHGQNGHITDHEDLNAWIAEASTWAAWNDATGGTITTVDNYNGSGEKWRVHTFTGNGTLDISVAVQPFRVLLVGGGASGGRRADGVGGAGGGAGGVIEQTAVALPSGALSVTVGAGGTSLNAGGASSLHTLTASGGDFSSGSTGGGSGAPTTFTGGSGSAPSYGERGGGGGGAGGNGGNAGGNAGIGGAGVATTITGTTQRVAGGGGGGGARDVNPGTGTDGGGNGGASSATTWGSGGGGAGNRPGATGTGSGADGVVIVAYRIG